MGRPAINTVFNPKADKNDFNQTPPAQQATAFGGKFVTNVVNTLQFFSSLDSEGSVHDGPGPGPGRDPHPGRPAVQPDQCASRAAQRPGPQRRRHRHRAQHRDRWRPARPVRSRRDGRSARRRRRPAHRLPVQLPVPRRPALTDADRRAAHRVALHRDRDRPDHHQPIDDQRARDVSMTTTTAALSHRRPGWRRPRLLGVLAAAVLIAGATFAWGALRPVVTVTPAKPATAAPGVSGDAAEPATVRCARRRRRSCQPPARSLRSTIRSLPGPRTSRRTRTTSSARRTSPSCTTGAAGSRQISAISRRHSTPPERRSPSSPTIRGRRRSKRRSTTRSTTSPARSTITDAIVRADATQLGALATRLDAEIELGRIADARKDLATLSAATSGPAIDVRAARLAYVTGDAARALSLSRSALSAASADDETDLGFYDYAVGEYARFTGDVAAARSAYTDALAVRDTDIASLVGLARIDAFEGRTAGGDRRAREGSCHRAPAGDVGIAGRPPDRRRGHGGRDDAFKTVRFVEGLGTDREHRLRSRPDALRARPRRRDRGASCPSPCVARGPTPTTRGTTPSRGRCTASGGSTRRRPRSRPQAPTAPPTRRVLFHAGAIALARATHRPGGRTSNERSRLGPALDPIERVEASRLLGELIDLRRTWSDPACGPLGRCSRPRPEC